jgi:hypothetical protein
MKGQAALTSATSGAAECINSSLLQRQCECGQHTHGAKCPQCGQRLIPLQRDSESGNTVGPAPQIVNDVLRSQGQPLERDVQRFIEPGVSYDLSRIPAHTPSSLSRPLRIGSADDPAEAAAERLSEQATARMPSPGSAAGFDLGRIAIHTGPHAAAAARSVNARAFAVGEHIVFGDGEYQPNTHRGQKLLNHELAHVFQQGTSPGGSDVGTIRRQVATADAGSPPTASPIVGKDGQAAPKDLSLPPNKPAGDPGKTDEPGGPAKAATVPHPPAVFGDPRKKEAAAKAAPPAAKVDADKDKPPQGETKAAPEPKSISDLGTGDVSSIDLELAEHERWGAAAAIVGAAGSKERADFIAKSVTEGSKSGLVEGFKQGVKSGVALKVAEKLGEKALVAGVKLLSSKAGNFVPVPGLGAAIGGAIAAYELASRDWGATGESLGKFGKGSEPYEILANSIEAASTALEVATQVLNVIAGVLGAITVVMWIATVATAGVLSPVAGTLTAIATVITIGTLALDAINALVLKRLITLFRSLHEFTSEADPRDVLTQSKAIEQAAAASTGFVGGVAGGLAVEGGTKLGGKAVKGLKGLKKPPTPKVPDHPMPAAATGDGASVTAKPPATTDAPVTTAPESTGSQGGTAKATTPDTSPVAHPTKPQATAGPPDIDSAALKGKVVHAAALQLGEKFETGAGVSPGERINLERRAATLKERRDAAIAKAGGPETKKGQTARNKYNREVSKLAERRQELQTNAWKEFWKSEGRTEPIDVEGMFEGWDKEFSPEKTGVGTPVKGPLVPDVELPISYSDIAKPGEGTAGVGTIARHAHQPPRGSSRISEHVNPGAQHEFATKGKGGPIYSENQYNYDYTIQLPKEVAEVKTHQGPTADNARTRALKAKVAKGGRIDVNQDLFLPGIKETFGAIDTVEQRKFAQAAAKTPAPTPPASTAAPTPLPDTQTSVPANAAPVTQPVPPDAVPVAQPSQPTSVPVAQAAQPTSDPAVQPAQPTSDPAAQQAAADPSVTADQASTAQGTVEPPKIRVDIGQNEPAKAPVGEQPKLRVDIGEDPEKQKQAEAEALEDQQTENDDAEQKNKRLLRLPSRLSPSGDQGFQKKDSSDSDKDEPFAAGLRRNIAIAAKIDPRKLNTAEKLAYASGGPLAVTTVQGVEKGISEPIVEHVNPSYPPPPCTPQDLVDIQNEIGRTLDARAEAEELSTSMAEQEAHHKANEEPLENMTKSTQDAIEANDKHKQLVDQRKAANQKKQENEKQSSGTLSDYSDRAAKLVMLTDPLRAFRNFTGLAYGLPDTPDEVLRVKRGILKMNSDAGRFLSQLEGVDKTIADQKASQPQREGQTQADQTAIQQTGQQAQQSDQAFDQTKQKTGDLDKENKAKGDEAKSNKQQADQSAASLDAHADKKNAEVKSLAEALRVWAHSHEQARTNALDETKKRLEKQGYTIVEVKPL